MYLEGTLVVAEPRGLWAVEGSRRLNHWNFAMNSVSTVAGIRGASRAA